MAVSTSSEILKPLITHVSNVSQGSNIATSAWERARKNWTTQLLIHYGMLESQAKENGDTPECFNKKKLSPIKIEATSWWDKTHKVCDIGGNGNQDFVLWFPRDTNGIIDLNNGQYNKNRNLYQVKVKYKKEVWMFLGCAITYKKYSHGNTTIE